MLRSRVSHDLERPAGAPVDAPSGAPEPPRFRVGLGYRRALHGELMEIDPARIDFLELAPENYCGLGGRWRRRLEAVRSRWPVITHGLALSLGGSAPLDPELIAALAEFTAGVGTPWHSDHLCWSSVQGSHLHDLLPMPFTRDSARWVAERIRSVAADLPVPLAIENVSAYARRPEDTLSEAEFINEVLERAGCKLLLDVNNLHVNAVNFGLDPYALLAAMPAGEVVQIHVAGHLREDDGLLIDTHGEPIADPLWPLLGEALRRTGPVPVLLERDFNIPPLAVLLEEIARIRVIGAETLGDPGGAAPGLSGGSARGGAFEPRHAAAGAVVAHG